MAQNTRPILGISMGNPGGIGPEICVKALSLPELYGVCRALVVGDAVVMADAVRFSKLNLAIHHAAFREDRRPGEHRGAWRGRALLRAGPHG